MIAERFHTVPAVITEVNPQTRLRRSLIAAAVNHSTPAKAALPIRRPRITLEVSASDSALRAKRGDGPSFLLR
jgi:hypothetical protein